MKKYILFVLYISFCLLIGKEFHPFSLFPMYNNFPNWSYAFFLENEKKELVPFVETFSEGKTMNAGYVGHTFYSFMKHNNFPYHDGQEDSLHIKKAGEALMSMILGVRNNHKYNFDTLKLYRKYYYLEKEQLKFRDDLMYAKSVKP